jgi:cyclopropane fatty-acyl-phospholipid synthase-like methyltransferase
MVLAADRNVVGADQSVGMLAAAHMKHPDVRLEMVGLQELAFDAEFDATMTIDAMEHVPPEQWPIVLANLKRAVRPGGHLYLTVEEAEEREIEASFADIEARGLPGVRGETVADDTGGYHYYPGRQQVRRWLAEVGLEVVDEADEWFAEHGYGYHHLLCVSSPGRA